MKVSVIAASELGESECERWQQLQLSDPRLASPCFSHEFTRAAAAVRGDVRIAVLEDNHRIVGFFPHQNRWGAGLPVGGRLCDHHGVVSAPSTRWDWPELLKGAGLAYWQFDHLAAWQAPQVPVVGAMSPALDLSQGYEAWHRRKLAAGSTLAKLGRRLRKLEREVGPLRFEPDSRDPEAFATVLRLKSEQCRRTGQLDYFSWDWTRGLVDAIRQVDQPHFGGRLSTLHAGDTLLAAHFGMRSHRVWHWWFPVYGGAHAEHSPGLLLLMMVAQAAADQGHLLLDLGKGDEPYKRQFADTGIPLVEGLVSRPAAATLARGAKKRLGTWLRTAPAAAPVRPLLRQWGRLTGIALAASVLPELAGLGI